MLLLPTVSYKTMLKSQSYFVSLSNFLYDFNSLFVDMWFAAQYVVNFLNVSCVLEKLVFFNYRV